VPVGREAGVVLRRHSRAVAIAGFGLLIIAALILRLSPLWPGPGLPAGATRLQIQTAPPHLVPTMGCRLALLSPARVATDGDHLILVSPTTGEPAGPVVWPSGWSAWRRDDRAELVTRDGEVVAREGELTPGFAGGVDDDGAFHVCIEFT
jgi:hypothetical protein